MNNANEQSNSPHRWEIEYRTPNGDWGMEKLTGSRAECIAAINERGDTALKARPAN